MVPFISQRKSSAKPPKQEMSKFITLSDPLYNDDTTGFSKRDVCIKAPKTPVGSPCHSFIGAKPCSLSTKDKQIIELKSELAFILISRKPSAAISSMTIFKTKSPFLRWW